VDLDIEEEVFCDTVPETHAFVLDGWILTGNCTDWIEYEVNETIDAVWVHPWEGPYHMYVSVMENGQWVNTPPNNTTFEPIVPYDPTILFSTQYPAVDTHANIPYVDDTQVNRDTAILFKLPRLYNADRIRLSFRGHQYFDWGGPWHYRCGVRKAYAYLTHQDALYQDETKLVKVEGNYRDYADIIRDLLLWSGWWLIPFNLGAKDTGRGDADYYWHSANPEVYGNIESTGIANDDTLPHQMFDKRPVMDAIHALKDIVGYLFYTDEEGAAHFESPNWWEPGNYDIDGTRIRTVPEISEAHQLVSYGVTYSDQDARSEIIISTEDPTDGYSSTLTTRYAPPTKDILRGMVKPAMWVNGYFTQSDEQQVMAELIGLHIFFRQRQAQSTSIANPCLSPNDQVRFIERQTSESFIHYVRGLTTDWDFESGEYMMTMTTHWLGDQNQWAIIPPEKPPVYERFYIVQDGDTWDIILSRLRQRYGGTWTKEFIMWVNQDLFHDTDIELLAGMVLNV